MHHAARSANLLVVQALLGYIRVLLCVAKYTSFDTRIRTRAGASLELQEEAGHTPLHLAAALMSLRALEVVRALVDAKAPVHLLTRSEHH